MYIRRKIETRLMKNLERAETMVLVGPRQAGKWLHMWDLRKQVISKTNAVQTFPAW